MPDGPSPPLTDPLLIDTPSTSEIATPDCPVVSPVNEKSISRVSALARSSGASMRTRNVTTSPQAKSPPSRLSTMSTFFVASSNAPPPVAWL